MPHRHGDGAVAYPDHKWLLAIHLMSASKKGMSAHQLHRMLGVTYKSAWFLAHRIREAMKETNRPAGRRRQIRAGGRDLLRKHLKARQGLSQRPPSQAASGRDCRAERPSPRDARRCARLTPYAEFLVTNAHRSRNCTLMKAAFTIGLAKSLPHIRPLNTVARQRRLLCWQRRPNNKRGRKLFRHVQARNEGHLSQVRTAAPRSLHRRI